MTKIIAGIVVSFALLMGYTSSIAISAKRVYHSHHVSPKKRVHVRFNKKSMRPTRMVVYPYQHDNIQGKYWQWGQHRQIPQGAKIIGYKHNRPYYLCRAKLKGKMQVGHYYPKLGCYVGHKNMKTKANNFLVLMK